MSNTGSRNDYLVAACCGLLFGAGLALSRMIDPARVLGFLDVLGGAWDPTLLFVFIGALLIAVPGFAQAREREQPYFAPVFVAPAGNAIDRDLLMGAVLFGIGWGLAGICPGPAVVNLASLEPQALLFAASMLGGMFLFKLRHG